MLCRRSTAGFAGFFKVLFLEKYHVREELHSMSWMFLVGVKIGTSPNLS
jgi:hypothetical protein